MLLKEGSDSQRYVDIHLYAKCSTSNEHEWRAILWGTFIISGGNVHKSHSQEMRKDFEILVEDKFQPHLIEGNICAFKCKIVFMTTFL